ncbi:MAG: MFS transporter, partial [Sphingomonas sp.]
MLNALGLLKERRFMPLFVTQFLGAFNDNLFKTSMVLFATYQVFNDPKVEQSFNALATGLAILPFFLLSALSGQLADTTDKAKIIRIVKTAEIAIMLLGAAGLMVAKAGFWTLGLGLMLSAVLCLGAHSTFFGPIKYAILPQHLKADEVLGGTGLVEAATYLAILLGTIFAGVLSVEGAAIMGICVALIGWLTARMVPAAPREGAVLSINYNPFTASWRLINATMHIPRLFLAICAISFFWTIGAVLIVTFPPLVKNVLTADPRVSSIVIALFSIGIAIGSIVINTLLKGRVSAKYAPASVIAMGGFIVLFSVLARTWTPAPAGTYYGLSDFVAQPGAIPIVLT